MTVSTTENRKSYAGNGVTTAFSFPYYFSANADLVVVLTTTAGALVTKTLTTHYTVTGAGVADGGTVTMLTAPATGESLVIYRDPELTQESDFVDGDALPAATLEGAFDKLTTMVQRASDSVNRSLRLADGDAATTIGALPIASARASKLLSFDADGNPEAVAPTDGTASALAIDLAATTGAAQVGYAPGATGPAGATVQAALENTRALADDVVLAAGNTIIFEGATDNDFETTLSAADPTADRAVTVPDKSGTLAMDYICPIGTIIDFGGTVAPTGFLECPTTSTTVSRTTYAELFAVIGTTWGVGDGSTTFGIPFFPTGYAAVAGTPGSTTVGEVIAHTHTYGTAALPHTASGGNPNISGTTNTTYTSGSTGGAANLAAGRGVMKCIRYT